MAAKLRLLMTDFASAAAWLYTLLKRNGPILIRFTPSVVSSLKPGSPGMHITLMGSFVAFTTDRISLLSVTHGTKMPSMPGFYKH